MACILSEPEKIKCPDTQKEVDLSSFDGVEVFLYECRPIWKTEESEQLQKAERYYSQLVRFILMKPMEIERIFNESK